MATLREIRRQLHSVANIEKITQAMEMVAASRLRKAQVKAEMSRPYATKLREILNKIIAVTVDFEHPLIDKREIKKVCYIVIAGDRGLCGAYNYTVFSTVEKLLKKYQTHEVDLIPFGRKAVDYFAGKRWKIRDKVSDWGGKISYAQIETFTKTLIEQYLNHEIDEVWLVYTHYINIAARQVMVEKLLNIENPVTEKTGTSNYIFEPDATEIFAEILPRYCSTKVQLALHEAYASELAARIFSMRAATKNAEEMIEKLTLVRNKLRQSSITRELIELTSGAESLK